MEKEALRSNNNNNNNSTLSNNNTHRNGADGGLLLRSISDATITKQQTTPDLLLQWGSRKRLRCMKKVQVKDQSTALVNRTTVRVDRRVARADKEAAASNQPVAISNGYFNLRHRPSSPPAPPPQRVLRNSENSSAMRGQSNGGVRKLASPDRGTQDKRGSNHNHQENNHNNRSGASSETAHDSKKGGSSTGSGEAAAAATQPTVWPPKFVIALTNKEKEEDFFAFKGSKLPQRPKKRSKFIQRTLNLVSPGTWLCDLTLDRYEVREKKASKKKPRGLKAMGNMESDSD